MGYILGYGAHCFELYGMRTWIVAFWTYVVARNGSSSLLEPIVVSVLVTVLAMPASILGNEFSIRFGRHRAVTVIQVVSALVALSIGALAGGPPLVLLVLVLCYAVTVPADSGSLTAGMSASADPRFKGATMAMHSTVGFGLSALARCVRRCRIAFRLDGRILGAGRGRAVRSPGFVVVATVPGRALSFVNAALRQA